MLLMAYANHFTVADAAQPLEKTPHAVLFIQEEKGVTKDGWRLDDITTRDKSLSKLRDSEDREASGKAQPMGHKELDRLSD